MPLASAPRIELVTAADARLAFLRVHDQSSFTRVRHGVYARLAEWQRLTPWERYDARVRAFAADRPDTVFTHESAATILGLPVFGEPRDIHVLSTTRTSSRRFGDVCVHTSVTPRRVEERDGVLITSQVETAVDLMRVLPPAFGLAVADMVTSADRGGAASVTDLEDFAATLTDSRGRRRFALLRDAVDARAESIGESVSRAVILWLGYEPPQLQQEFRLDGHLDRVDMWWPSVRAIGESDGYGKYVADSTPEAVASLVAEKRREDRLRRQCNALRRWDWAATMQVAPLDRRMIEMGVPRVARPRTALLATLRSNPRSLA